MNQTRVVRLVDAHARRREAAQLSLLRIILALLGGMANDDWYDEDIVKRFAVEAMESVREAQQQVASVTMEYLVTVLEEMDLPSLARMPDLPDRLRDVDPTVEWSRPAEQYRYAKSRGASDEVARKAAQTRAEALVDGDLTAGMQHATVAVLEQYPQVTGYRRVIHPEMSKSGTCGLCIVVADRVYRTDRLLPVHDSCNCGVLPITAAWDPGSPLNDEDLKKLYAEAGGTSAEKLKRIRVEVEDHSELGPRLTGTTGPAADPVAAPEPVTAAPSVGDMSDADLEKALEGAWEAGDQERADELMAEIDDRERAAAVPVMPQTRAGTYTEQSTARWTEEDFDDELVRLMEPDANGWIWIDQEAVDQVGHLLDLREQQQKADAAMLADFAREADEREAARKLLDTGPRRKPATVDEQLRSDYDDYVHVQWLQAEEECAGALLNNAGKAAGISPSSLWSGTTARARKYASEELKTFWQRHGRINYSTFRADALGRASDRGARDASTKEGWYDSAA